MNIIDLLTAAKGEEDESAAVPRPYLLVSDVTDFHGSGGQCLQSNPCQHTAYFTIDLPDKEPPPPQVKRQKAGGPPSLSGLRRRNCKQIAASIDGHTACLISRMMGTPPESHFAKYDAALGDRAALPAEIGFSKFVLRYDRDHPRNVERMGRRKAEARTLAKAQLAQVRQRIEELKVQENAYLARLDTLGEE